MTEYERADLRIQAICEKIRMETLDPAKEQAQEIIEQAKREADHIRKTARSDAEKTKKEMLHAMQEEKQIFLSSLEQAAKQTEELIKQKIEKSLFNPALNSWIQEQLGSAATYAKLSEVLIEAIRKEGTHTDISVKIPESFSADAINAQLGAKILESLKNHSVQLSDLPGGIQIRLEGKKIVIDLSTATLAEIIAPFVRKDFRKMFFST